MPGRPAARAGGAEALAMPGLPSARAAGAEALVLRAAERSLKDVLELVHAGALDPSTLGSLSGLCEELKLLNVAITRARQRVFFFDRSRPRNVWAFFERCRRGSGQETEMIELI